MAVFDANFLVLLLDPDKPAPIDPATGKPTTQAKARIEHLVKTLEQTREKVVVPAPALAEFMVKANAVGAEYLRRMERSAVFVVAPFDKRAAIELAAMTRSAIASSDKFDGSTEPWHKVKFDRQIIAIAKVMNESKIYSTDGPLRAAARRAGLSAFTLSDIALPPEDAQGNLAL